MLHITICFEAVHRTSELIGETDWHRHALGAIETWPCALRTLVRVLSNAPEPMLLWWSRELYLFYNVAAKLMLAAARPTPAMGQAGTESLREIWPALLPQLDAVLSSGVASRHEDQRIPVWHDSRLDDRYWSYTLSPVQDGDDASQIAGVIATCHETTAKVRALRRSDSLCALGDATVLAPDDASLEQIGRLVLPDAREDIPWAVLAQRNAAGHHVRIIFSTGLPEHAGDRMGDWIDELLSCPIREIVHPHTVAVPPELAELAQPGWAKVAPRAFMMPVPTGTPDTYSVFALCGLNPRQHFDADYRRYLERFVHRLGQANQRLQGRLDVLRARVQAEANRNNLLLQAPVAAALLTGPDHVYRLTNQRYCEMIGRYDLVGKTFAQAFPDLVNTDIPAALDQVYRLGKPYVAPEAPIMMDIGNKGRRELHYYNYKIEPIRDSRGKIYGMIAIGIDITDQVRARQVQERSRLERESLLHQLEVAARAKDEFLAMLGHELRNPLSPIVTALQLMKMRGDHADTSRERLVIQRQVDHLVRLVDDLLDVSRITRGLVELRVERTDLVQVLRRAVEMVSVLVEQRRHELRLDVPAGGLPWEGDPVRLAQVVANLLTNAARYTDPGGKLLLQARREGDEIVIRVIDNGPGIEADLLPVIFDLFVQGKRTSDRTLGGLGIGLALVRNLVEMHGGTVEAFSEGRGLGSEFVVRLPGGKHEARPEQAFYPPASGTLSATDSSRRVLVVDDNADAADLLGHLLRERGHEVQVAHNAASALQVCADFTPQVAILDIGLPVMDGYELAGRLRGCCAPGDCRFIALTGYGQPSDKERSRAAGFSAHLVKPIELAAVLEVLSP